MTHIRKFFSVILASTFLLALATVTYAQGTTNPPASRPGLTYELKSPLAFSSLPEFIEAILGVIIVILTPIIVLFIIFAGFKYVTAQGNPAKIQEATKALTYAVIGGVLIIGAFAITQIIKGLVDSFV